MLEQVILIRRLPDKGSGRGRVGIGADAGVVPRRKAVNGAATGGRFPVAPTLRVYVSGSDGPAPVPVRPEIVSEREQWEPPATGHVVV